VPVFRLFSNLCQIPQRGPHGKCCPSPEPSSPYFAASPEKEPPSRFAKRALAERQKFSLSGALNLSLKMSGTLTPHSNFPYAERYPLAELSSTRSLVIHLFLKVPGK